MRPHAGVLVLVAAGFVFAQAPPDPCEAAARLLRSPARVEKAWGAHYAAGCQGLGGALTAELAAARLESADSNAGVNEWRSLVQALLDSFIQNDTAVSLFLLARLRLQWPAETFILLLRNPAAEDTWRSLALLPLPDAEWVAVNNVLAARRAKGEAAVLLSGLELTGRITVYDAGPPPGSPGAGFVGGGISAASLDVAPGFPPTGFYRLVAGQAGPARTLVADGPERVWFERLVSDGTTNWKDSFAAPVPRQELRIAWLARLSGLPEPAVRRAVEDSTSIEWRGVGDFQLRAARALAAQPAALRALVQALVDRGVLSSEDAASLRLRIGFQLIDLRAGKTPPLPPPQPVDVRWRRP